MAIGGWILYSDNKTAEYVESKTMSSTTSNTTDTSTANPGEQQKVSGSVTNVSNSESKFTESGKTTRLMWNLILVSGGQGFKFEQNSDTTTFLNIDFTSQDYRKSDATMSATEGDSIVVEEKFSFTNFDTKNSKGLSSHAENRSDSDATYLWSDTLNYEETITNTGA